MKLAPLYDLFFNGRISLTPEHFLKISPRFEVKNELDAMMALHQSTILGMSAILHDNALSEFAEITKNHRTQNAFKSKSLHCCAGDMNISALPQSA